MASAPSTASRSAESATPGAPQAAQPAIDVTAITTRDDFLLELGEALDGQAAVRPVETLDGALQSMAAGKRAQLLVIDAREVSDVRAAVDAAQARVPSARVLVFTEAEQELGAALKGSKVFAVLSTAIEPRKTAAVFQGAIAEALAAKSAAPAPPVGSAPPLEPELTIGAFRPQATSQSEPPPHARPRVLLIGAAAAVVMAAGAWWYFTHATPAPATRAAPPAVAAPNAPAAGQAAETAPVAAHPASDLLVEGKVDDLLEKARLAMHERRYTDPAGDNALLYYRSAVAADSHSAEALDGLQRVAGVLGGRLEEALGAGRLDEAALTLANFKAAAGADSRLASFEQRLYAAQMAKALADGNLERAAAVVRQAQQSASIPAEQITRWRNDIARHQEDLKVQKLVGVIEERIHDGKLTDADDGAAAYLQQLQSTAPANPATARAVHELTAAYLKRAREAALAKNNTEEERWLTEARGLGMRASDVAAFQHELLTTRQKATQAESEHALQLTRAALRDGRLTDPAQDSAAGYLTQLQSSDPANAALPEMSRELAKLLVERARTAVQAGKSGDADLTQAKHWGADPKDLLAVQQLSAAQSQALDPATLAASLKRVRAPAPDYPPAALTQHIAGSVTLEYTVNSAGEPHDIHVVEATPPGVFDQAAINAVKHWRYAPLAVNGAVVEVPVKARMRFELPK